MVNNVGFMPLHYCAIQVTRHQVTKPQFVDQHTAVKKFYSVSVYHLAQLAIAKTRYNGHVHKQTFAHDKCRNDTEVSKKVWEPLGKCYLRLVFFE